MTLKGILRFLPYIHKIIWFNFHYLPFDQAIKLPILLYRPNLKRCKGLVEIHGTIRTGMIKLGIYIVSTYPNKGIVWENSGKIVFDGKCTIGNNSYLSIGKHGIMSFGDGFCATADFRGICYHRIIFGHNILVGWSNTFTDTDFHAFKTGSEDKYVKSMGYAPITIGDNTWFAMRSIILKGTQLPPYSIVGAGSILSRNYMEYRGHCLFAGNPARMIKENVWRDINDDSINYK